MPTSAHSRHSALVPSSTPSLAAITNSAQSAARSPARTSPTKSAYPGVSTRLILVWRWTTGAMAREMERPCFSSASSKSQTVVPSLTVPARGMAPAEASSVSTKVVLPEPPGPTSTTLRIRSGLLAPRSCPAGLRVFPLSAIEDHLSINVQGPRQLLLRRFARGGGGIVRDEIVARRARDDDDSRHGLSRRGLWRGERQRTPRCMGSARGSPVPREQVPATPGGPPQKVPSPRNRRGDVSRKLWTVPGFLSCPV